MFRVKVPDIADDQLEELAADIASMIGDQFHVEGVSVTDARERFVEDIPTDVLVAELAKRDGVVVFEALEETPCTLGTGELALIVKPSE